MQLDKKQEPMFNADFLVPHLALNDRQVKELTSRIGHRGDDLPIRREDLSINSIREMLRFCLQQALYAAYPTTLTKRDATRLLKYLNSYDEVSKSLQERQSFPIVLPQDWLKQAKCCLEAVESASKEGKNGAPKKPLNSVLYPKLLAVYEIAFNGSVRKSNDHLCFAFINDFLQEVRLNIDQVLEFKRAIEKFPERASLVKGAAVQAVSKEALSFAYSFLSQPEKSAIRMAVSRMDEEEIEKEKTILLSMFASHLS